MSKVQDTYILERTLEYPNCIVRVHRPVLTEEERERRMNNLKKATERFMKAVIAAQKGENNGT